MNGNSKVIDDLSHIHSITTEDAYVFMKSRAEGLTAAEALERQELYGKNVVSNLKEKPMILVFLSNFISMMAILLWVGGLVALFAKMPQLGIAIWLVNVINGVFSFWQEFRASKATEALKKMLSSYAKVVRDGVALQILTEDLVPGDVVLIAEGDKISADARLIECSDLQIDQSTLTGESNPVRKTQDPVLREGLTKSEMPNLIFAGTSVSSGTAKAIVISIGMATEFGKIANLAQTTVASLSPLQKELNKLTKQISIIALAFGVFFFFASVFVVKENTAPAFIFSLGMVVAFIPEGLLPTVTLSLAMAVQRMAKDHALVKKLSAVETLGCTTVICSDKTGTLTQNEMTVCNIWLAEQELVVTGVGYAPVGEILAGGDVCSADVNIDLKTLLVAAALCSNAHLVPPAELGGKYTVLGDPTEACLETVARKGGLSPEDLALAIPRIRELPFDSRRKRMSTIHQISGERIAYVKGAPKEVLDLCVDMQRNGVVTPLSAEDRQKVMAANDDYARKGLRVLAVAFRKISRNDDLPTALSAYTPEILEQKMVFVGLVVMADPPRPEVAAAVAICHQAKIRIIMITGDYGLTAESIAKRIGITSGDHPRIVSGVELENFADDELKTVLKDEVIFARVAPEQKYRVVCCLQELGEIVAVTGDGVNDSPALKKADIGVAMGISGTDVAKESADMILTDDNFASIVKAIEEGRGVYANIRKFLTYILNSNMPEAVPSAAFLFSRGGIPLPLTIMQILSIDLGTDMLPALGLGAELPESGVMNLPPRSRTESLLNKKLMVKAFIWYGIVMESVICMAAYFYVNIVHGDGIHALASSGQLYRQATTMTLAAIVFCQIGMVMNCRTTKQSVFKAGLFSNPRIIKGIVFEVCLICAIIYVPFLQDLFQTASFDWKDWIFLVLIPFPVVLLEEIRKAIVRWSDKMKRVGGN